MKLQGGHGNKSQINNKLVIFKWDISRQDRNSLRMLLIGQDCQVHMLLWIWKERELQKKNSCGGSS